MLWTYDCAVQEKFPDDSDDNVARWKNEDREMYIRTMIYFFFFFLLLELLIEIIFF